MAVMGSAGAATPLVTRLTPQNIALAALGIVLAIAAYTRFVGLGTDSLWRDEAYVWVEAHGSIADIIRATAQDNFPPLHNFMLAASMHLFGDSEWALRLPSALLGFANVLALYWVGTMVGGRTAGVIAALLLTFSPFHMWYSQEARDYTLLALSATLFVGASLWLMQESTLPRVISTLLAGAALLYSHPYGAFIWLLVSATVLVILLLQRDRHGLTPMVWALLQVAVALAFAPWAWVLVQRLHLIQQNGFWIPRPTVASVLQQARQMASGWPALILASGAALLAVVPLPSRLGRAAQVPYARAHLWILGAWLLSSFVIGIAVSLVSQPIFISRYTIGSLPALLLLAALGMTRFVEGWRSGGAVAAFAVVLCVLAVTFGGRDRHEDWRDAVAYVVAHLPQDACVLAPGKGHRYAFDYYARGRVACLQDPVTAPVTINSKVVVVVLTPEWSRRLLSFFQPPQWRSRPMPEFPGVEVFYFERSR